MDMDQRTAESDCVNFGKRTHSLVIGGKPIMVHHCEHFSKDCTTEDHELKTLSGELLPVCSKTCPEFDIKIQK